MSRALALACGACLVFVSLLGAKTVSAQTSATNQAAAEALFEEALKLTESGDFAGACPKFKESQRLDPGVGTLLYLADCYENIGRTASAWATFREAGYAANAAGDSEREQLALQNAARLKPDLSHLKFEVGAEGVPEGFELYLDEARIGKAVWAVPVPVDPGEHRIKATAPGKKAVEQVVQVPAEPTTVTAPVPVLEDLPKPRAAEPAPVVKQRAPTPASVPEQEHDSSGGSAQRTWGFIVGGAGVVGGGFGIILAARAKKLNDQADSECSPEDRTRCTPRGVELGDEAGKAADAATFFAGVGAAALLTGTVLVLTAPSGEKEPEPQAALSWSPRLGLNSAGLVATGVF